MVYCGQFRNWLQDDRFDIHFKVSKDSESLLYMDYICTIFSSKPFHCDAEYEAFDSKTDWLENSTKVHTLIPRELLFARKHHSISGHQNDSNPNLELIHGKQSDTATDQHGEKFVLCNFLLHFIHITLKDLTI